jgi:hypothetical protein
VWHPSKLHGEAREKGWQEARELIANSRRQMNLLLEEYKREHRTEIVEKLRQVQADLSESLEPDNNQLKLVPLTSVKAGDAVHIRSLGHAGVVLRS